MKMFLKMAGLILGLATIADALTALFAREAWNQWVRGQGRLLPGPYKDGMEEYTEMSQEAVTLLGLYELAVGALLVELSRRA